MSSEDKTGPEWHYTGTNTRLVQKSSFLEGKASYNVIKDGQGGGMLAGRQQGAELPRESSGSCKYFEKNTKRRHLCESHFSPDAELEAGGSLSRYRE